VFATESPTKICWVLRVRRACGAAPESR